MEPQIYNHLPLPLVKTGKPKRSSGGSASDNEKENRANRGQHSATLVGAGQRIYSDWHDTLTAACMAAIVAAYPGGGE